jgi:hypothetical protein
MKFRVSRTSIWSEAFPCEEAKKEPYIRIDRRTSDAPEKIPAFAGKDPEWWYSEGRNHRVVNGMIEREFDTEGWFIEINTLEELMAFEGKYGKVIVSRAPDADNMNTIEIYDGWRE